MGRKWNIMGMNWSPCPAYRPTRMPHERAVKLAERLVASGSYSEVYVGDTVTRMDWKNGCMAEFSKVFARPKS